MYMRDAVDFVSLYMFDDYRVPEEKKKLPHIKKLISCVIPMEMSTVDLLVRFFPNLVHLRIKLKSGSSNVGIISRTWRNLRVLHLYGSFSSEQLSDLFFGKSLKQVNQSFIENKDPGLALKHLTRLSMDCNPVNHRDILSHILHYYYPCLDLQVDPDVERLSLVSGYRSYISHSIALNPQHSLRHCDVRVEDLRCNGIAELLKSWINLDSISLILTEDGGKALNVEMSATKLKAIFTGCAKLDSVRILNATKNPRECVQLLVECFKVHGAKFEKLSVTDYTVKFPFNDFFKLVNMCPNLKWLGIFGLDLTRNQYVELNTMEKLQFLTCMDPPLFGYEGYLVVSKMIRKAPKLYYLAANLNTELLDELEKLPFSNKNKIFKVHVRTQELSWRDHKVLVKVLKNMKVKEFILYCADTTVYDDKLKSLLKLQSRHQITIKTEQIAVDRQFPDKWRFEELAVY